MGGQSDEGFEPAGITKHSGNHVPVLIDKVLMYMDQSPGKIIIDATGGPGNMSKALLENTAPTGRVLTIDCDPRSIEMQDEALGHFGTRSVRRRTNFSEIAAVASEEGFNPCDGIIYDLGVSSPMLDNPEYGMSIRHDARLDMRFDPDLTTTAFDLVNYLPENELVEMIRGMDEKRFARPIVRAIIRERKQSPIETTTQLADLIHRAVPKRFHPRSIHVATRTFLSLRARVNSEAEALKTSLDGAREILNPGGVLVVICYSSFEDRKLKAMIRDSIEMWKKLTKKVVRPDTDEIKRNPRSRSARLRAYQRVA